MKLWGFELPWFKRSEPECAVLEIDETDGRRQWGVPVHDRKVRRYFLVSSTSESEMEVRECAQRNGLPKVNDSHPKKALVVDAVYLRRDEVGGVWQALVGYWNEGT